MSPGRLRTMTHVACRRRAPRSRGDPTSDGAGTRIDLGRSDVHLERNLAAERRGSARLRVLRLVAGAASVPAAVLAPGPAALAAPRSASTGHTDRVAAAPLPSG